MTPAGKVIVATLFLAAAIPLLILGTTEAVGFPVAAESQFWHLPAFSLLGLSCLGVSIWLLKSERSR